MYQTAILMGHVKKKQAYQNNDSQTAKYDIPENGTRNEYTNYDGEISSPHHISTNITSLQPCHNFHTIEHHFMQTDHDFKFI